MTRGQATRRLCRCGALLAPGATGSCRDCERVGTALRHGPPDVPAAFWDTEELREAFLAQHMGCAGR
jgi:hypothetical protein